MPTKIITDKVFTDKVLVYFLNHMSIFGKSEPANVVTEGYSEKIHKKHLESTGEEYFPSKVVDLQSGSFWLKRGKPSVKLFRTVSL